MSFKLSSFSQRLSGAKKVGVDREGAAAGTNAGETKEGEAAKPGVNKPRRKVKQNIILAAKTDIYVDDEDYCKPTFSRTERLEYWTHLLSNKGMFGPTISIICALSTNSL